MVMGNRSENKNSIDGEKRKMIPEYLNKAINLIRVDEKEQAIFYIKKALLRLEQEAKECTY